MIKTAMNIILASAFCAPAICAEPLTSAAAQLNSSAPAASAAEIKVSPPVAVEAKLQPGKNWAEAAKAAYDKAQDEGGLTTYADLLELPPGARSRLDQELQTLPQGPGNSSEAFKMMVNGRTAFVVQSYINSDTLRVYIFNAAGVLVARGGGSADTQFVWAPVP